MKAKLLEALKQIRERPAPRFGICHQTSLRCSDADYGHWRCKIRDLFRKWPQFSGSADFPVPHPTEPPCLAYNEAKDMWDWRTKYGRARWDLLDFCISELEKELCDGESRRF